MNRMCIAIGVASLLIAGCNDPGMGNKRKDQVGETVVGQSMARARDAECMNNLSQIRQFIQVYKTSGEDTNPASLDDARVPKTMQVDPIDKKPYEYDPTTGTVKCKHPGHEKY
ncbi:MAG: hypothetical protein JST40_05670 [Armatimonadetes bacterium]|nr:hypothetical protein [Armatimonadota bacterium]